MRIALIAHDSRKELMAQFCTAYVRILSENDLIATGVTGKIVHDATGLPVRTLYPGGRGGAEQIAAMIGCGEVDMLLFFRDPVGAKPGEPNDMMLLRLCDMHTMWSEPTREKFGKCLCLFGIFQVPLHIVYFVDFGRFEKTALPHNTKLCVVALCCWGKAVFLFCQKAHSFSIFRRKSAFLFDFWKNRKFSVPQ